MTQVHNDIPIPRKTIPNRSRWKFPYATMNVGDSFFQPCPTKSRRGSISTHTSETARNLGRRFVTRSCWVKPGKADGDWVAAEKGEKGAVAGVGVWRTE